jgi:hypothetical protein
MMRMRSAIAYDSAVGVGAQIINPLGLGFRHELQRVEPKKKPRRDAGAFRI